MPPKPKQGPSLKGTGLTALAQALAPVAALADVWDQLTPDQRTALLAKSPDLAMIARAVTVLSRLTD